MAVDINSASAEELTAASGIKPEVAMAICEYRDDNGGFVSFEEITMIPGVDEASVEALRNAGVKAGVSSAADTEGSPEM